MKGKNSEISFTVDDDGKRSFYKMSISSQFI